MAFVDLQYLSVMQAAILGLYKVLTTKEME